MTEQRKENVIIRLMHKWDLTPWRFVMVLLAFSLAGSTVLKIGRPIINWILPDHPPRWEWWTVRILLIVPIYELLLLAYGTLLGQYAFFSKKQKQLLRRLVRRTG